MKAGLKAAACICLMLLLASCGGRFSCKETIDGTRCETLTSVYEREVIGVDSPAKDDKKNKKKKVKDDKKRDARNDSAEAEIIKRLSLDEGLPIRVTPKIIRIWVSPWEDSDGDLHQSGYIYSEISDKKGRWLFGEKGVSSRMSTLAPVTNEQEQEDEEEKSDK